MTELTSKDAKIVVDDEGFLADTDSWNEDVAELLAEHEGIENLDTEKMKIISFLRDYYLKHHNWPILANVCRKIGSKARNCVFEEFKDPMKAWKVAGLPKPPNIFFTSFDDKKYIPNPFY